MSNKLTTQDTFNAKTQSRSGWENFDNWETTAPIVAPSAKAEKVSSPQSAGPLQRFDY